MSWMLWLAAPAFVTALAALVSWLRARPRRVPTADQAMREHAAYLAALSQRPLVAGRQGAHPRSSE